MHRHQGCGYAGPGLPTLRKWSPASLSACLFVCLFVLTLILFGFGLLSILFLCQGSSLLQSPTVFLLFYIETGSHVVARADLEFVIFLTSASQVAKIITPYLESYPLTQPPSPQELRAEPGTLCLLGKCHITELNLSSGVLFLRTNFLEKLVSNFLGKTLEVQSKSTPSTVHGVPSKPILATLMPLDTS